jgi:hypothetical protein
MTVGMLTRLLLKHSVYLATECCVVTHERWITSTCDCSALVICYVSRMCLAMPRALLEQDRRSGTVSVWMWLVTTPWSRDLPKKPTVAHLVTTFPLLLETLKGALQRWQAHAAGPNEPSPRSLSYLFKINFNIILSSALRIPKSATSSGFVSKMHELSPHSCIVTLHVLLISSPYWHLANTTKFGIL